MNENITIKIADIIGSNLCISSEDGQKVFDKIIPLIKDGKKINISFERIETIISLFLNSSIGQLYGEFNEDALREQLTVSHLEGDDFEILKRVIENAKSYYSNPQGYDSAWEMELNDEE